MAVHFADIRTFRPVCFLLLRLVAPQSLKDVLHLSFHPIGAGIFTGAALALVASGVVALLVAVGYLPEIKYDYAQWDETDQQGIAVLKRAMYDCYKQESIAFRIVAAGLQEPYDNLKPPIDTLSFLRPVITVLYLIIAAFVFRAATARRKSAVLATVLLSALLATGANIAALKAYRMELSQLGLQRKIYAACRRSHRRNTTETICCGHER